MSTVFLGVPNPKPSRLRTWVRPALAKAQLKVASCWALNSWRRYWAAWWMVEPEPPGTLQDSDRNLAARMVEAT